MEKEKKVKAIPRQKEREERFDLVLAFCPSWGSLWVPSKSDQQFWALKTDSETLTPAVKVTAT